MKILHISKYYYPYLGGVENICKYLVEQMPQHEVGVVCFNDKNEDVVEEVNGHKVWRVASVVNIARQALSISYKKMLRMAIDDFCPDVVHYHWANPFPVLMLKELLPRQTRLVIHWHMDIIRQWYLYWAVKPLERWLIRRADFVCVTSPQYRDGSKPLSAFKDKVRVVPNCIEESKFEAQPQDAAIIENIKAQHHNKPIVLFLGRHTKYKGLPHLIEAERFINADCEIVIGGSGPLTDGLKALVTRRNASRIKFVGRLSDDEMRCYMKAASVFAFPSITKNEAFGVALAEAMYCETPAVTFTIPGSGVNWVNINGETGLEVPNSDDEAFGKAIDKILSDKSLQEKFSQSARQRVSKNFLLNNMISAMEDVYEALKP